jgi:hypothetical protein
MRTGHIMHEYRWYDILLDIFATQEKEKTNKQIVLCNNLLKMKGLESHTTHTL